ncbi:hypothetical protein AB0L63_25540 [Nocardia sp. NPDC051990]|uniref:hypothetical protein n=1 Tax=Nocardia sp. NPDC051990 TaxID=3155285 RepID=UPI003449CF04
MTDLDTSEDAEAEAARDWRNSIYEVFNPDYSVGVACDRAGMIVGLYLGDDVLERADDGWLAAEVLRLARLAHVKSRVGRRAELLFNGGPPDLADLLELPTEAAYDLMEKTEFARDSDYA